MQNACSLFACDIELLNEFHFLIPRNSSRHDPEESVFVIGQGAAPFGRYEFGIVCWDPRTGKESFIGQFTFCPHAMHASLKGGIVFSTIASQL